MSGNKMTELSMDHDLEARLLRVIRADSLAWGALEAARDAHRAIGMSGWRVVSGVIYNAVWNAMDPIVSTAGHAWRY